MIPNEVVRRDERKYDCGQNMKEKEDDKNQGATNILIADFKEPGRGQSQVQQHAKASNSALVSDLTPSLIIEPTRTSLDVVAEIEYGSSTVCMGKVCTAIGHNLTEIAGLR